MHDNGEQSGFDSHVQSSVADEDAADDSEVQLIGLVDCVIGNTHVPAFIFDGEVYLQAPLRLIFEAFAEDVSEWVRDMEVRVSDSRGAALSLDRAGRTFSRPPVAEQGVGGGRK